MTAHESTDGRESQTDTDDASTTGATDGGQSHVDDRSAGGTTTNRPNTASGLEPNVAGAACYALAWLTGLFFFFTEKEDEFVRFHAAQSIVAFGALTVAYVVLGVVLTTILGAVFMTGGFFLLPLIGLLNMLLGLVGLALWLGSMYMAYQGRWFELPIAGRIANDMIANGGPTTVERKPVEQR